MIRLYRPTDIEQINKWYALRKEIPTPEKRLPIIGYVEDNVAAGFIYQTDSCLALLEGYISNPEAEPQLRNKALDDITIELLKVAKDLGFSEAIALSRDETIMKRAVQHGFKGLGAYYLFTREV